MDFNPEPDLQILLSSVKTETLKKWKHEGEEETLRLVHDPELEEDVLHFTGKYGYNEVLVFPNRQRHFKESSIEMTLPNINFFYKMEDNPFGMDIVVEATSLKQYIFRFGSNYPSSIHFRSDVCWLPLTQAKQWSQCSIDLGKLVESVFQAKFARIIMMRIKTTIKLRKIFLTRLPDAQMETVYSQIPMPEKALSRAHHKTYQQSNNYRDNRAARFRIAMQKEKLEKDRSRKTNVKDSKVVMNSVREDSIKHQQGARQSKYSSQLAVINNKYKSKKPIKKTVPKHKINLVERITEEINLNDNETKIQIIDLSAKIQGDKNEIIYHKEENIQVETSLNTYEQTNNVKQNRPQTSVNIRTREGEEDEGNFEMTLHKNKLITGTKSNVQTNQPVTRTKYKVPIKCPKYTSNDPEIRLVERKDEVVNNSKRKIVTRSSKNVNQTPTVQRSLPEPKTSGDKNSIVLEIIENPGKVTKRNSKTSPLRNQVKRSSLIKHKNNTKPIGFHKSGPKKVPNIPEKGPIVHLTDGKTFESYYADRKPSTPKAIISSKIEPATIKDIRNTEIKSPESKMQNTSKTIGEKKL